MSPIPKGRPVDRALAASVRTNSAGVELPTPIIPRPPPADTAAARSPPATPAIGAPMIGAPSENRSVTAVRSTVVPPPCSRRPGRSDTQPSDAPAMSSDPGHVVGPVERRGLAPVLRTAPGLSCSPRSASRVRPHRRGRTVLGRPSWCEAGLPVARSFPADKARRLIRTRRTSAMDSVPRGGGLPTRTFDVLTMLAVSVAKGVRR